VTDLEDVPPPMLLRIFVLTWGLGFILKIIDSDIDHSTDGIRPGTITDWFEEKPS
jgi:hypothetical protein